MYSISLFIHLPFHSAALFAKSLHFKNTLTTNYTLIYLMFPLLQLSLYQLISLPIGSTFHYLNFSQIQAPRPPFYICGGDVISILPSQSLAKWSSLTAFNAVSGQYDRMIGIVQEQHLLDQPYDLMTFFSVKLNLVLINFSRLPGKAIT